MFVREPDKLEPENILNHLAPRKKPKSNSVEDAPPTKRDRKVFRDVLVKKLAKEKAALGADVEIDVLRYYYYIQVKKIPFGPSISLIKRQY